MIQKKFKSTVDLNNLSWQPCSDGNVKTTCFSCNCERLGVIARLYNLRQNVSNSYCTKNEIKKNRSTDKFLLRKGIGKRFTSICKIIFVATSSQSQGLLIYCGFRC